MQEENKMYQIPHNYTDNGRIFNMFEKEAVKKALIVSVPLTLIIFNLPLRIDNKLFFFTLFAIPIMGMFLFGLDTQIMSIRHFFRRKKIYYLGGLDEGYTTAYEKEKIK